MRYNFLKYLIFLHLFCAAAVFSQTPTPTPIPESDDQDVVKISTQLIQVDATVTDKKGNIIRDLKPEDFEIYQNGKKQEITNFSFISNNGTAGEPVQTEQPKAQPAASRLPPVKLKAEDVHRTYALVVDDLGLSFGSIFWVKKSLKKFIEEQMQEGDLVAILRVSGDGGALQSFTSDKRQLLAAVDKVRWNGMGRVGVSSFEPIDQYSQPGNSQKPPQEGVEAAGGKAQNSVTRNETERQANLGQGTLGALSYVIRGMRILPGRKSVMLFSEGFPLMDYSTRVPEPTRVVEGLRALAELATRSSVVIHTLDPRGLQVGSYTAEDRVDMKVNTDKELGSRTQSLRDSKDTLRYLAAETGGVAYVDLNDMDYGLKQVMNAQNGYYLIGYQPDSETFDASKPKFNQLQIKLTRPDLKIRYQSGFAGITDEKYRQTVQSPTQKLAEALVSPFGKNEVSLDLYSIFYNDSRDRNLIQSLVYIDAKDLTFVQENDGSYHTSIRTTAAVFDTNGASADNSIETKNLKFTKEQYQQVQREGMIYNLVVPIIKTGGYQFRMALEDVATGKVGSASQFIEIPNLDKKKLTISNILVKNYSMKQWKDLLRQQGGGVSGNAEAPPTLVAPGAGPNPDNAAKIGILSDTAQRRFSPGSMLGYMYVIYNAKAASQPQLQVQVKLFRDGKLFVEGAPARIRTEGQTDLQRIEISDVITLGTDLANGDYVMQLIVTDDLKKQVAFQTVDFEIVK